MGSTSLTVFIGWDAREQEAYRVAEHSLREVTPRDPPPVYPLKAERLAAMGLLRRPTDLRGGIYDLPSNAPCSTEFAISRFVVPHLCQSGFALFVDADVVFMSDLNELRFDLDPRFAVQVVKHEQRETGAIKMDGRAQVAYRRKNWSSVTAFNCDHPANRRLSLQDVNERPGRDLHAFYWLHDEEIGELPPECNWLVGVDHMPDRPRIAHFTLGGPWLPNWTGAEHDYIWTAARDRLLNEGVNA